MQECQRVGPDSTDKTPSVASRLREAFQTNQHKKIRKEAIKQAIQED